MHECAWGSQGQGAQEQIHDVTCGQRIEQRKLPSSLIRHVFRDSDGEGGASPSLGSNVCHGQ